MKTRLQSLDWERFATNLLVFTAPVLGVFFGELATGVTFKIASLTALIALYGILADFFKKYNETK